jgi:hypothetical protein
MNKRGHLMARFGFWAICLLATSALTYSHSAAAEPASAAPEPADSTAGAPTAAGDNLAVEQGRIADKYARLEQLLVRMAEIESAANPQRAALLRRAIEQSSERLTRQQLNAVARLLTPPAQLSRALEQQERAVTDLQALLALLLSENRSDRLKDEQARVREYIKEVERLLRLQRGVQGRTQGGEEMRPLSQEQGQVEDRTGRLAQQIRENEESSSGAEDRQQGGSQPQDAPPQEQPSQESPAKETPSQPAPEGDTSKPQDGQPPPPSPADPNAPNPPGNAPSPSSPPQEGQPGDAQQSPEQPAADNQPPTENDARQRLESAQQRMKEAQKRLDEAKRQEALEEQQAAERELEKAKAELEEILRQMREEEVERTLALLEARFRRMLEMQVRIHEATKKLDEIPAEKRGREVDIQANKLSFDQNKLVTEADKALLVLQEEGSSVAFPETVEQLRDDMRQIADRLAASKVDRLTQGLEQDVIDALEEMIQALQKAQQDLEKQKQQEQQQEVQEMSLNDLPLVDKVSEIKMIRALQMRVNTRTQRYAELLKNPEDPVGHAEDEELRQSLINLAEKQQRVFQVTRDIVLGKNR